MKVEQSCWGVNWTPSDISTKILTARKLADVDGGKCAKYCSSKCLVTLVNDNGQSDLRAGKCLGEQKSVTWENDNGQSEL